MILGCVVVFGTLIVMNRGNPTREQEGATAVVDFSVATPPPQPQRQQPPPERRREVRTNQPALAPIPDVAGSLSSIQVEMPEYQPEGLDGASESLLGNLDDVVMTEDSVDSKPVVRTSTLQYPERAKQREIEGRVVVSVLIGADGRVKNMKILEATPPGVFEEAVRSSVPQWTFEPAKYKGRSVQVWATVPLDFNLR